MKKLFALVQSARNDKVPPGWLTVTELAKKEGYASERAFYPLLKEALRLGLVECKDFRVTWGTQSRLRPHYRRVK